MNARIALVLVAALACAACAVEPKRLYKGERLPPGEEVTLTTRGSQDAVGPGPKLFLVYLDGASLQDVAARITINRFPYPHSVYLKPGPHRVKVLYASEKGRMRATIMFDGAPGRTYLVRALPGASHAETKIWIEDAETGQRVGSADSLEAPAQ